ncbi:MFS transporter [Breznakiella homolactica]|uniref:MFS transporter n=1 Tax=Breznakiella homolactica TaxID=2798577 RepID=A0A7T7XKD7_9SPIR|nr:MFS transporter [Breznakiella homolactica]QQO08019.1 MFS transporter [Breznakiella homolactica]
MQRLTYSHTRAASYIGYVTQAIMNNLAPLLFLTFQRQFSVSLSSLALLITMNFTIQLLVDLAAARFVDRIGYRRVAVAAHIMCTVGLLGLGILPSVMVNPYTGIMIAMAVNAAGGGLIEVIISPIVEAIPGDRKAASMSILHSFYCWGYVAVVALSTLYFTLFGTTRWQWLPMAWALVPFFNIFFFAKVPLRTLIEESSSPIPLRKLFTKKTFILLSVMMVCAGASEQAMSQWASLFAEAGLKVPKTMGDLLGPCLFAVLMGLSRVFFGTKQRALKLETLLLISGIACVTAYGIAVFAPHPILALAGCGLCGLSVGMMWPGTFSLASRQYPRGGTAMFAMLALAGDVGCAAGPGLVGLIMNNKTLKIGLLTAVIFPVVLTAAVTMLKKSAGKGSEQQGMGGADRRA